MIELNVRSIRHIVRTRAQRRSAMTSVIKQLELIRDAEIKSLENTPANFTLSPSYYVGETIIECIEHAIDSLTYVYNNKNILPTDPYEDNLPF